MTAEEEANLWARLVALETKVTALEAAPDNTLPGDQPQPVEPPRDRHMPHDEDEPRLAIEV
jgi:hypothetical protein